MARSDVVEMHCRIILPLHVATESRSPFSAAAVLNFELFDSPGKLLNGNAADLHHLAEINGQPLPCGGAISSVPTGV